MIEREKEIHILMIEIHIYIATQTIILILLLDGLKCLKFSNWKMLKENFSRIYAEEMQEGFFLKTLNPKLKIPITFLRILTLGTFI